MTTTANRTPRPPKPGRSLAEMHPAIAAQWAHDLNDGLTPGDVGPGTHRSVWWRCGDGHQWQAAVNNRTGPNKNGCPTCAKANRGGPDRPPPGKSLQDLHPTLSKEWSPKNDLTPTQVFPGSNYRAWWICLTCGNEWSRPVKKRVLTGSGCRRCISSQHPGGATGPRSPQPGASLADLNPVLAKQWHPTGNGNLTPADVTPGAAGKVWWLGVCGHAWSASPEKRNLGHGCLVCVGKVIVPGVNDLEYLAPEVALEWAKDLNGAILPSTVSAGSHRKVWWRCSIGHEFKAAIVNRVRGAGCRYCAGQAPIVGKTDLGTTHQGLAAEWAHDLNGDFSPSDVMMGTNQKFWWRGACGHVWMSSPNSRTGGGKQNGCPTCSGKIVLEGFNDLRTCASEVAEDWAHDLNGGLTPETVHVGSSKMIHWRCPRGHVWVVPVAQRTGAGTGCPSCSGRVAIPGETDFATLSSHLVGQWHPTRNSGLTPQTVSAKSARLIWWVCTVGHEWRAPPVSRFKGHNCPYCSGRKAIPGVTDLGSVAPAIALEWHPTRNGNHTPEGIPSSSHRRVWWLSPCGHEWRAEIRARTIDGVRCHVCSNLAVVAGVNDLATTDPRIAAEWASGLNGGLLPSQVPAGSNISAWWRCQRKHEWKTFVYHRTLNGSECPDCHLPNISREEIRLAFEVGAHVDLEYDNAIVHGASRRHRVDMLIRSAKAVIEFDGAYWHRNKHAQDISKTLDLEAAGYIVIRVREPGLAAVNAMDVAGIGRKTKDTAVAILHRLADLGIVAVSTVEAYKATEGCVAAEGAAKYLQERLSPPEEIPAG